MHEKWGIIANKVTKCEALCHIYVMIYLENMTILQNFDTFEKWSKIWHICYIFQWIIQIYHFLKYD